MATTADPAEADEAKKQVQDDAAVGSISHILRTLFRGLYEESEAPEDDAEAEGPACSQGVQPELSAVTSSLVRKCRHASYSPRLGVSGATSARLSGSACGGGTTP